jgi:PhnB protein
MTSPKYKTKISLETRFLLFFGQFSVSEVNFFQYKLPGYHYITSEQGRSSKSGSFSRGELCDRFKFCDEFKFKERAIMAVNPIPEGYHTITPCLTVQGANKLIDFMKRAFEATEIERMTNADGTIKHAEVRIGDSVVMISESRGEWKPMPGAFYLYVNDADVIYKRAIQAGAVSVMEPLDTFYGNRESGVKDQFGNYWWIATHIDDISPEEMERRAKALVK